MADSDSIIPCPACGHLNRPDFCDGHGYLVTYWGDQYHDYWCEDCDHQFQVQEMVTRDFVVVPPKATEWKSCAGCDGPVLIGTFCSTCLARENLQRKKPGPADE